MVDESPKHRYSGFQTWTRSPFQSSGFKTSGQKDFVCRETKSSRMKQWRSSNEVSMPIRNRAIINGSQEIGRWAKSSTWHSLEAKLQDHSYMNIKGGFNGDLQEVIWSANPEQERIKREENDQFKLKIHLKKCHSYLNEFSHLLKMIEKVKKPSEETFATASLLMQLLSERFWYVETLKNDWTGIWEFIKMNISKVRWFMLKLPEIFLHNNYNRISELRIYFTHLLHTWKISLKKSKSKEIIEFAQWIQNLL